MTTPSRLLSADREREAQDAALTDWRDMDAEWRRLRRIEAAARAVIGTIVDRSPDGHGLWQVAPGHGQEFVVTVSVLRAALSAPETTPAGVLPHAECERNEMRALEERDAYMDWADRLAYSIAPIEVIGEHSNMNDPWQNAIDHLEGERQAAGVLDEAALAKALDDTFPTILGGAPSEYAQLLAVNYGIAARALGRSGSGGGRG